MAPEWFKTAIQGPAYGQHMRRPGIKLTYRHIIMMPSQDAMEESAIATTGTSAMTGAQ